MHHLDARAKLIAVLAYTVVLISFSCLAATPQGRKKIQQAPEILTAPPA